MASIKKLNTDGAEVGTVEGSDIVFGAPDNEALVHDVIIGLQANQRQGTHATKTRSDVSGGGVKPFRQKGTGRARQGTTRAPQFRHGGTVFGPQPRGYRHALPIQWKRQALCSVLSSRLRKEQLNILTGLKVETPKAKAFAELLGRVAPDARRTLLVTSETDQNTMLATRNNPSVFVRTAADVNALDVLLASRVVVQEEALAKLEERLS